MSTAEETMQAQCQEGAEGYAAFDALDLHIEQAPEEISTSHPAVVTAALACSKCVYLEDCTQNVLRWVNSKSRRSDFQIPPAPTVMAGMLLLESQGFRSTSQVELSPSGALDSKAEDAPSKENTSAHGDNTAPRTADMSEANKPTKKRRKQSPQSEAIAQDMPSFRTKQKIKQDARAALAERRRQRDIEASLDDEDEEQGVKPAATRELVSPVQEITDYILKGKSLTRPVNYGQIRQALSSVAGDTISKDAEVLERFRKLQGVYQDRVQDYII